MNDLSPPKADRRPVTIEHHSERVTDEYAWLRDDNWQEVMRSPAVLTPDIRAYLEAENRFAKENLAPTEDLQDRLFEEIKARIKEDDSCRSTKTSNSKTVDNPSSRRDDDQ